MENKERNNWDYYGIDIVHVLKTLWTKAWIVILCGILTAGIGFSIATFAIAPTYSSHIKLYVNNSSFSLGNTNFSISSSELTAAQSLVKTYGEILKSRTTLERVIDKADINYNWKTLSEVVTYVPSNNTEIMLVTVTTKDPYEASKIANTIAEILPVRISEIIDGASMEVVDSAVPETNKVAPSITTYTAAGLFLGAFCAGVVIAIVAVRDDTIHDEEYILKTYEFPILGKIPDLMNSGNRSYSYYYKKNSQTSDKVKM